MPSANKYAHTLAARTQRRLARERFSKSRRAEKQYERQLLSVARYTGQLIKTFASKGVITDLGTLRTVLNRYADTLRPWAFAVSARMQSQVSQRDMQAWSELGREVGRELHREISKAPTGKFLKSSLAEQVELITSIPLNAARRVHLLTMKNLESSARSAEIKKEIMRSSQVSEFQARRIARTETSRTATELTKSRAIHIGAEFFIWRTAADSDVRLTHKKLNGKVFRWDDPPVSEESGERALPGGIWNCRCYPEPVINFDVEVAA